MTRVFKGHIALNANFNIQNVGVSKVTSPLTPPSAHAHPRKAAGQTLLRKISLRGKETRPVDNPPILKFLNQLDTVSVPPGWHCLERRCVAAERGKKQELKKALSSRLYPVPHIVSTAACQCSLTGTLFGRRFSNKTVNKFLADLFLAIPKAVEAENLPETTLSRYDLHHAHLFCSNEEGLGLLFHSKEYIVSESGGQIDVGNLGNCQIGTPLEFENEAMAWRNIIWLGPGQAASVNVGPESLLNTELLMDGLHEVCTVLEDDLGETLADIYFIEELGKHGGRAPPHRVFVIA